MRKNCSMKLLKINKKKNFKFNLNKNFWLLHRKYTSSSSMEHDGIKFVSCPSKVMISSRNNIESWLFSIVPLYDDE